MFICTKITEDLYNSSSFSRSGPRAILQPTETYFEKNTITVTFFFNGYLHGGKVRDGIYFLFHDYTLFKEFNGKKLCEIDVYLINNQITIIEDGS